MAKGSTNGIVRGKKGNTVFYKVTNSNNKEKQGWREYTPVVANPNTAGQQIQRAIMSTVMRAYSAGKAIFDHSFQGISVGGGCMKEFMRVNAKLLRNFVAIDLEDHARHPFEQEECRLCAPGVNYPAPNKIQVASGNYEQRFFKLSIEDEDFPSFVLEDLPLTNETTMAYVQRTGLVVDDIYTIVGFGIDFYNLVASYGNNPNAGNAGKVYACYFGYVRLRVKEAAFSDNTAFTKMDQIFEIDSFEGARTTPDISSMTPAMGITINSTLGGAFAVGAAGMIRSRKDMDLRSNTKLEYVGNNLQYGLQVGIIPDAWGSSAQRLADSTLILEGGE